jgi:hypothetical protein
MLGLAVRDGSCSYKEVYVADAENDSYLKCVYTEEKFQKLKSSFESKLEGERYPIDISKHKEVLMLGKILCEILKKMQSIQGIELSDIIARLQCLAYKIFFQLESKRIDYSEYIEAIEYLKFPEYYDQAKVYLDKSDKFDLA